jgi:hypothetical protein
MSATLETLQDRVKRRVHILRATTSPSIEVEKGNIVSDNAITDALNDAIRKITVVVLNAQEWFRTSTSFLTTPNVQEYDIGDDVVKIERVVYNVTISSIIYGYDPGIDHTIHSVTVTGLSLTAGVWAGASIHYWNTSTPYIYKARILTNDTTTLTLENGDDLPAIVNKPCMLEKLTGFTRTASTYETKDIGTAKHEEASIDDPHDTPAASNPMYRFTNKKLRIITSADNTQSGSIGVWVEYIKEVTALSVISDITAWPDFLDAIAVEYATYLVLLDLYPNTAILANREFWAMVQIINASLQKRR